MSAARRDMTVTGANWWSLRHGLLILAVRRCQPLWLDAGLPEALELHADAIRLVVLRFLLDAEGVRQEPSSAGHELNAGIDRVFTEVGRLGGSDLSEDLRIWLYRFHDGTQPWGIWVSLLAELSRAGGPSVDLSNFGISAATRQRVITLAQRRYGPYSEDFVGERERTAQAIPLSTDESRLLTIDTGSRGPEDDELLNIVADAAATAIYNSVWTFWQRLSCELQPTEVASFFDWAQAQHAALHEAWPVQLRPLV
jgi:hypothetical protein